VRRLSYVFAVTFQLTNKGSGLLFRELRPNIIKTVGQRDRQSFHFKPEPSRESQILRARILGRDKMNISEYPFSTFIGIDVSKDKLSVKDRITFAGEINNSHPHNSSLYK